MANENPRLSYRSTKKFHWAFSCAFRQHRADSHCRYVHGYALSVAFEFAATELDVRNWVVDFGSLKGLKGQLEDLFDHKTVIAADDPEIEWFHEADRRGILQLRIFPQAGCERFAEYIYEITEIWLVDNGYNPRVQLVSVEVHENGNNSAKVVYNG